MRIVLVKSDPKAREKPCLRCGYSLRKLADSRHCPECGLSIWLSLNPNDSLDWSRPEWLRRMTVAAWVMAVSQLVGLAAYAMLWQERPPAPVFATASDGTTFAVPNPAPRRQPWVATSISAGLYLMAYNAALILMATDEGRHPDRWHTYRWACRIVGGVGIFIGAWLLLVPSEFLFKLGLFAGAVATFAYLRKLAQRIPNSPLVRACGVVLFIPLLSLLKTVPIFWCLAAFQLFSVIDYLPWVYLPASVALLGWFAILFRKASVAAEEGWRKESAGDAPSPAANG